MKHTTLILLLFAFSGIAQKAPTPASTSSEYLFLETYSSRTVLDNISDFTVKEAVLSAVNFGESATLNLTHRINSKAFTHYHFELLIDGKVVFASSIHASVDQRGVLRIQNIPRLPEQLSGSFPSSAEATNAQSQLRAERIVMAREVLANTGNDLLQKALLVELEGPETLHMNVLIANGEIIYQQDLHKYHSAAGPHDTTVSVGIFEPDPLTSAQVAYGAPYSDAQDKNTIQLEAELKVRNTTMTFKNGAFRAENDFVKLKDFSLPNIAPVSSTSPYMVFTRDSASFEDVNVIYHITNHKEHLINLGYPGLPSYRIEVDPHALDGSDQSFFSTGSTPYRLYLGEGGVDDAEDADVIIHEFMHAVMYEASPSLTVSIERGCIEEAICDYFAASYSSSVSSYNVSKVFNWDAGDGNIWPGRAVESTKNYGALSFKTGNYYTNTDILASCLMTINREIGREKTDELVLEAIFNLTGTTNMPELAGYMILADSALYNGAHYSIIYSAFLERSIVPMISVTEYIYDNHGINVYNTIGFAHGAALQIESQKTIQGYTLYNFGGQLVAQGTFNSAKQAELYLPQLIPGAYILTVHSDDTLSQSFRLLRF